VNSNHYHTDHHQLLIVGDDSDTKLEELVTKKLHRIATGYRIHADKLRRTAEMEYELATKVEQCFMMTSGDGGSGSNENNSQSKNNLLLLSTKLLEKQRLMEECLAVNDRVVHQLLSTSSHRHNELLGYPPKTVTSSDQKEESNNSNNNNNKQRGGGRLFHEINFVPSATSSESSSSTVGEYDDLGQLMGNGGLMHDDDTNKENEGYDTALQVIHHTARDWTYGAMTCRDETIGWIVRAIIEYSSGGVHNHNGGNDLLRVLVPGAGLGRLAYDISTCRHLIEKNGVIPIVEANDSSVTMIFAAQNVLKMLQKHQQQQQGEKVTTIFPFVSDPQINEIDGSKRFEMEVFPDEAAIESYKSYSDVTEGSDPNLSFTIGDFVSTYSQQSRMSQYDVVATSFFIDTATNIYEYIFIMKHLLDGNNGIWVNCGPVQWHPCALLRPTVEQLRDMLEAAGFELLSWSIADEVVAYRHPDDVGGNGIEARYTKSEAYRPLRFVARPLSSNNASGDEKVVGEDLPLRIQYTEYLNEVASGKVKDT
jgi:hypothetical protein